MYIRSLANFDLFQDSIRYDSEAISNGNIIISNYLFGRILNLSCERKDDETLDLASAKLEIDRVDALLT